MKKVGDWNQCRCGQGYQETERSIKEGYCEDCLAYFDDRDRKFREDCAFYGCPSCGSTSCFSIWGEGICPDHLRFLKIPKGLIKIVMGIPEKVRQKPYAELRELSVRSQDWLLDRANDGSWK